MITFGVNQISSPGIPGNISVFGPNSFGVIQDKKGQIFVAGAKYYNGRIILWSHDGFFKKDSIENADTGNLLINTIRWTAGKPKVGVVDNSYLVSYLNNIGFQANLIGIDNFHTVDVLIGGIATTSKKQQIEINNWLKQGGAIIDSATGWGWQQIHPDQQLSTDFAGNVFFARAGLVFADGFSADTTQDGFLVQPPSSSNTNAYFALESLVQQILGPSKITEQEISILSKTLTIAANCIPADDRIFRPKLKKILGTHISQPNPSPDKPIKDKDILQRLAMLEEIRQSRSLSAEDIKAHVSAKTFPGISLYQQMFLGFFLGIKIHNPFYHIDYNKTEAQKFLSKEYGWKYYGGHHHENLFTRFAIAYWLPKKFNIAEVPVAIKNAT